MNMLVPGSLVTATLVTAALVTAATPAFGQSTLVPVLPILDGSDFFPVAESLSTDGTTVLVSARRDGALGDRGVTYALRLGDAAEFVDLAPGFIGQALDGTGERIAGRQIEQPFSTIGVWDLGAGETNSAQQGYAGAISTDGSTVVGGAFRFPGVAATSTVPVRWVRGSAPTALLDPGPVDTAAAVAVSADGQTVVGTLTALQNPNTPSGSTGFLWEASQPLVWLDSGFDYTLVRDVTADGSTVVGMTYDEGASDARMPFLWTRASGFAALPALPSGWDSATFERISDDGGLAVGNYVDSSSGLFKPFLWTPGNGYVELFGAATGLVDPEPTGTIQVSALSGDGNVIAVRNYSTSNYEVGDAVSWLAVLAPFAPETVSVPTCAAAGNNSTGFPGTCSAFGSALAADDDLELRGAQLPPFQPAMFVVGTDEDALPLGGGTLCLGGTLARVLDSLGPVGPAGTLRERLDLTDVPFATGSAPVLPGETLHFQVWHRDTPAFGGSNLSGACRVTFL